jgi:hypothetical protein
MTRKILGMLILAVLVVGTAACYRPYGHHFYPDSPRFAPTDPARVELLRRDPKRPHIRIGEVWIRPDPMMGRAYVEGMLAEQAARMGADAVVIVVDKYFREPVYRYSYYHGPMAYQERQIVGVAIRFQK